MSRKQILCVCTETHTGMRDFAIPIIKAASINYDVCSLIVTNPAKPCEELHKMVDGMDAVIISQPKSSLLKMLNRIYSFRLKNTIDSICKERKINIIWLLTGDTMVAPFVVHLEKKYTVYYTVHDLFPHEAPYRSFKQRVAYNFFFQRHYDKLLKKCSRLITSSMAQYDYILKNLKTKKAFYHPFPSLVNDSIHPNQCPELKGLHDYILYFSTIGHYKGVDLLYNAFINSKLLNDKFKLVLAGGGKIFFERTVEKESNVIIINRFIKDQEIPSLFNDAKAVVFPYRTATQSGNISYVYHNPKLLLLSDIPYFKEIATDGKTALFFDNENADSLQRKLEQLMFETDEMEMKKNQTEEYARLYSEKALAGYIKEIFE